MEIKTKYNVGDEVYYIDSEKLIIKKDKITNIFVSVFGERVNITYSFKNVLKSYEERYVEWTVTDLINLIKIEEFNSTTSEG